MNHLFDLVVWVIDMCTLIDLF